MGVWGTAIFDDDFALDIKNEYQTLLAFGTPEQEAFNLTKEFFEVKEGDDDENVFWLAIAAIQEKYGFLTSEVRSKAIAVIDSGVDLENWNGVDKRTLEKRRKSLQELKEQLLLPNKERRAIPKTGIEKKRFGVGDILISQLVCKTYKDKWWFNKYVLYEVTNQYRHGKSLIKPELAYNTWSYGKLFDWIGDYIPDGIEVNSIPLYSDSLHALYWIPKNYSLKVLVSNSGNGDDVPFVKNSIECFPPNQGIVFSDLQHHEQHFKEVYENYKKI